MLDMSTVREINRQILDEMRTVNSIRSSHQEKMEAIERANALKKLLSEDRHEPRVEHHAPRPTIRSILGPRR